MRFSITPSIVSPGAAFSAECSTFVHLFKSKMKNTLLVVALLVFIASCSPYQKALKSEDSAVKIAMIDTMMKRGKYNKAIMLFEQIIPKYRGTDSAADMAIKYARALYENEEYPVSANQYERFVSSHPGHPARELAFFMAA